MSFNLASLVLHFLGADLECYIFLRISKSIKALLLHVTQNQTCVSERDRCSCYQKAQNPTKTAVVMFHPRDVSHMGDFGIIYSPPISYCCD